MNNQVRDGSAIRDVDEKRNKSVASKQGYKIQEQIRTNAAQEEDMMETRAMNRIKPQRYKEARKYGYDPITNVGFEGRTGTTPAPLRQTEQKPVWSRLQGNNRGQYGGGQYGGGGGGGGGGGVANPRDLSGADNGGLSSARPESNRERPQSFRGGAAPSSVRQQQQQMTNGTQGSLTVKPDFVPSLTIPSEGMVNGKLNISQKGAALQTGGFGSKR